MLLRHGGTGCALRKLHVWARNVPRAMARTSAPSKPQEPDLFHMGQSTLKVSRSQLHGPIREKLVAAMKERLGDSPAVGVALGGDAFHVYSSDGELIFKQEAYMHYLFGVSEEGWWGAVDLFSGQAHLFMPRLPEAYAVWMGPLKSCQDYRLKTCPAHCARYSAASRGPGPTPRQLTRRHPLKTEQEVAILRYANQVGSAAHVAMMRAAEPGLMEYQLEAT
ncbi:AMP_N domain-containing protein, partial [Haematococcus lacustris]